MAPLMTLQCQTTNRTACTWEWSRGWPEVGHSPQPLKKISFCSGQGAPPSTTALPKARHVLPMLSLYSVNSVEDVRMWHNKLLAKLPPAWSQVAGPSGAGLSWVVEPKVDGLAMSLLYGKDGKLLRVGVNLQRLW